MSDRCCQIAVALRLVFGSTGMAADGRRVALYQARRILNCCLAALMWPRTATGKLIHMSALRFPGERAYAARVGAPRLIARAAKIVWRAQGQTYRPSFMVSIACARASNHVMNAARRVRLNTKCYGPVVCIPTDKGAVTRALDHVRRMCAHMSTNMYTCMRNGRRHRPFQNLPPKW